MRKLHLHLVAAILVAASAFAGPARAQGPELDAALNESVVMVAKKSGLFTIELETTVYRPPGEGPFPLVVINHGKAPGNPRFQGRYRPAQAARYFLQRGYAVVVPMRQGFSKSTGSYIGVQCNVASNGKVQAEDVRAVLDWAVGQPWVDKDRILVVGQSHGGWTTLAFGPAHYPGVKGLVNFAGGLRQDSCLGWQLGLARGAAEYGHETAVPTLWFYGDNDSFFDPPTFHGMYEQYVGAGGQARLVAFGRFGKDSHALFGSRSGAPIWQPEVSRFLAQVGLPSEVVPAYAHIGPSPDLPVPPRSDFAALEDEAKLPHVRESGRTGYRTFLAKDLPRAFAIAPNGAWGWAEGGDAPLKRALANCNRHGQGACRLYAVDGDVVWKDQP